jgi:tetratricopeptide (TPR) repeat protein
VAQAEALYRKAEILLRAGNFRSAVDLLDAAVRLWPEEADYQGALGWALFKKHPPERERARSHLERAIALAPRAALWHARLALVLRELGAADEADGALRRAREIDPAVRA